MLVLILYIVQRPVHRIPTALFSVVRLGTAVPQMFVLEEKQTATPVTKILNVKVIHA